MYSFLLSVKQPDGSFIMHEGGEVDVRYVPPLHSTFPTTGNATDPQLSHAASPPPPMFSFSSGTYCALSVATILNLLTPTLAATTPAFVASCQTYEGGLASAAQAFPLAPAPASVALGEAHGGYAFCALASWSMLRVFSDARSPCHAPARTGRAGARAVDLKALRRWAVGVQAMPIEGGGFRGRSNKLVDGCYSWWGGGIFGVLGALLDEDKETDDPPEDVYSRGE